MNPLKRLAGDTAIYGISSIVGRFLNYLLVPIHTDVFFPGEYGVITELYIFVGFLNVIYMFGLETAYFRFAAEKEGDEKSIFNTGISFILSISLILSIGISLFATPIVNAMGYEGQEIFVYMFAIIMGFDALFSLPYARLRRERKSKRFASAKLTGIFLNIGINLFFLKLCHGVHQGEFLPGLQGFVSNVYNEAWNIKYVFIANLLGSSIVIFFFLDQIKSIRFQFDRAYLKKMLVFSYPLVFTGLAMVMNEKLSTLGLKYWLPEGFYPGFDNQDIIGIFGGVFKLAILMTLGIQAYRYAAEPFFFDQSSNRESPKLFARLLTWFVLFACVLWMGVAFNLEWLQYFLRNEEYRTAIHVVPILLAGGLFTGINYNLSAWYKLIDFTKAGTIISVAGGILTILLNYILIPKYGYYGAAYSGVAAYGTMCVLSYLWSRKKNPIPYNVGKVVIYLTLTALIVYGGTQVSAGGTILDLIIKNAFILLFIGAVYFIERRQIKPL